MNISGSSSLHQVMAQEAASGGGDAIARARRLQSISEQANSSRNSELQGRLDSFSAQQTSPAGAGRGTKLDISV